MVIHPHLILSNRYGQNTVRHFAQRLFTFGQADTIGFGLAFRQLPETAGRFAAVATGEGLNEIARLNVGVSNRQRVAAGLARTTARLDSNLFSYGIVGHFIARQTDRALNIIQARILRIFKDDNIAAFRMPGFDQRFLVNRIFNPVGEFLHQDKVTDKQRRHHRT